MSVTNLEQAARGIVPLDDLGFLEMVGRGCVSGSFADWPQLKPACRWAAGEIARLRDLVLHCWVHSGYRNCGYSQMDSQMRQLYDALISGADPEAKPAPTAVDLTLARPGDVCRYRDGGLGLIRLRIERKEKWLWHSSRDAWHQKNGWSDGRCPSADIIAVFDQRDGRLICGTERTVADG